MGLALASGREGKEEKERKKEKEEKEKRPLYYGRVEVVEEGQLWAGGRAIPSASPLLPYLAPGMVVELGPEGLKTLEPARWAYYEGPGAPWGLSLTWARVWWVGGKVWKALPGTGREALLVAQYAEGKWRAVPPGLRLPRPPREGWWLLRLEGLEGALVRFLN